MAEVVLVGQDNLQINKERAEEIKEKWDEKKFEKDDIIRVSGNSIRAGDIRSIRIEKKGKDEQGNVTELSTEELKNRLGDFEEKYKEHKSGNLETYEGLGTMDTGIHDWLEEKEVISGRTINPELYGRFSDAKEMLEELRYRREYAEEQEKQYKEQIGEKS